MYVGLSKEQEALRDELRAYYDKLLTPEVEDDLRKGEGVGQVSKDVWKQMCRRRLGRRRLAEGVGRPGHDPDRAVRLLRRVDARRARRCRCSRSTRSRRRSCATAREEQKQFYVDKILKGEIHFAIGYTEPDAGTDLASLKTKAVRDGDEYVINGQKVFTSLASGADYIWLAVRTSHEAKKHKGISIIIVPTDTPGFSYKPIDNFGDTNTNITYYEDVRVPVGNLVGEENQGWSLITNQLNHERVTLCSSGVVERQLDDVRNWAQQTKLADGRRVIDQEWVQVNLARVHAKLEFLKLANWQVAWLAQNGEALNPADASTIKVYGTEFYMEAARLLMEVMRDQAPLSGNSPGAVVRGRVERMLRGMHILTFGGGTNEMQRDLISIFGLNMPGSPR